MLLLFGFSILFFFNHAEAHSNGQLSGPWWQSWNFSILIFLNLSLLCLAYFWGWHKRKMRFPKDSRAQGQRISFVAGIFFLFVALISPLDPLSDFLSWVHMLQHTILMMIAAPLLALSSISYVNQWVLPKALAKKIWVIRNRLRTSLLGKVSYPLLIFWLYTVTLWIWHLPVLYEAALSISFIHDLQHLSFFLTSYLFWVLVLDPFAKRSLRPEISLLYLFVSSIHAMVLGVLMALSPQVWYEPYLHTAPMLGWNSLEDQQLAGLIMWMPAGISYLFAAIYMFSKLLKSTGLASPHN